MAVSEISDFLNFVYFKNRSHQFFVQFFHIKWLTASVQFVFMNKTCWEITATDFITFDLIIYTVLWAMNFNQYSTACFEVPLFNFDYRERFYWCKLFEISTGTVTRSFEGLESISKFIFAYILSITSSYKVHCDSLIVIANTSGIRGTAILARFRAITFFILL